ncbi:MAG: radical SAM protein [bacterium]|nr:radical SAM protein [bacterium]
MKVAFITSGQENLGVEYLSSSVRRAGHEVRLFFDPQTFGGGIFLRIELLRMAFDLQNKIAAGVIDWRPDIIGFSCMTHNYDWSLQVARKIKEHAGAPPIIFGGIHPTSVPESVLSQDCVDMVAVGESETSFVKLVDSLGTTAPSPDVKGIQFKREGRIFRNKPSPLIQDLDSLPFPDKKIFHDKVPGFLELDSYSIMAGRGCPFSCTYCCNDILHRLYRGQSILRKRSVSNVIEELRLAKERFAFPEVFFQDDVFPSDLTWLEEFSERYRKEIGIPFQMIYHFKFTSEAHIRLLRAAGCYHIAFGVQSVSERVRREICNRFYTNEEAREAIRICRGNGIIVKLEHMFGFPTETADDLEEAVEFYRDVSPDLIYTYWLVYYPATSIVEKGRRAGLLSEADIGDIVAGRRAFYHRGTSIRDRKLLMTYQLLFDLVPLLPRKIHQWLASHRGLLKLLPRGYISHFFLVLLADFKTRQSIFSRYLRLMLSRKNVP